jgi:nitrogenase iron protein NifH
LRGIAFYGKGGIGKSTTLSNVTAALSAKKRNILQIGCDPKHDSTRLLLGGFTQSTVLEQLKTSGSVSLDQVMLAGYNGINCIESGGPEPGVGCAGRGIIQMLNLLDEQGLDMQNYDYVFFDVLGDVVCGGFAVPMRKGYADEIYIVTSGEIASLYAANNIAKGLKRFSTSRGKLGGIIGNGRGTKNEREVISTFAKMIGTEMVAFIPRSELVAQAELASQTIREFAPKSELASIYQSIADHIELKKTPVVPKPLSDEELERFFVEFVYGSKITKQKPKSVPAQQPAKAPVSKPSKKRTPSCSNSKTANVFTKGNREIVRGCSLAGAISVIRQLNDAVAIMHSPQGCSYIHFWAHIVNGLHSDSGPYSMPNLLCTNMQEKDVIFGGDDSLKDAIMKVHDRMPSSSIFIVSSCPAGIIGEDVDCVVDQMRTKGVSVYPVSTDGVMQGDYVAGMFSVYEAVADNFIDEDVVPDGNSVNFIGCLGGSRAGKRHVDELSEVINDLGINVNCHFIRDTTLAQLKQFRKADANILATGEPITANNLPAFFEKRFNMETLDLPLPVAFEQTEEFAHALASRFGKESQCEKVVATARTEYEKQLRPLRKFFSGKKTTIFSFTRNIDWLLSTLIDLGVEISKVCAYGYFPFDNEVLTTKYDGKLPIERNTLFEKRNQIIEETHPDFILTSSYLPRHLKYDVPCYFFPMMNPSFGFNSGLDYAEQLQSQMNVPFTEGWRNDRNLF